MLIDYANDHIKYARILTTYSNLNQLFGEYYVVCTYVVKANYRLFMFVAQDNDLLSNAGPGLGIMLYYT